MDSNDVRNVLYIQSMIDYVKKKAVDYYFTPAEEGRPETAEDRLNKAKAIRDTIKEMGGPLTLEIDIYGCPSGWKCVDGVCIEENIAGLFWPETDPKPTDDSALVGSTK